MEDITAHLSDLIISSPVEGESPCRTIAQQGLDSPVPGGGKEPVLFGGESSNHGLPIVLPIVMKP
ncbi:hypothetical protein B0H10DRAFT_2221996 [Mycena sp. CBHHK59/15]|nr:hypothetical protein B0H10DRAFT_2221996 [Mycena sp. CBHHK59/15]